jgi:hypothetical protein
MRLKMMLLAIGVGAVVAPVLRAEPPAVEELDVRLDSVLPRANDVFAAHGGGIFRADRKQKSWQKLKLPAEMPTGGLFGMVPADSPQILYYSSRQYSRREGERRGLYASDDAGQSWRLLAEGDDFGPVALLKCGALFSVTNAGRLNGKAVIEVSRDMGQIWRDISNNSFGTVHGLFPDPDHPGLICLDVNSIRGYILQAEDERYEWKATRSWEWHPERRDAVPFGRTYSTTATRNPLYGLSATLRNYFDHDFGSRTSVPAIDLSADESRFVFRAGDDIQIPITVRFLEDLRIRGWSSQQSSRSGREVAEPRPVSEKLLDHPTDLGQWGLRVEYQGKRDFKSPAISAAIRRIRDEDFADRIKGLPGRSMEQTQALLDGLKGDSGWKASELSAATPYRRVLNLSKLYDFSRPGEYRVQLDYDSTRLGDRSQGHWVGAFSGPVFTIAIEPRD